MAATIDELNHNSSAEVMAILKKVAIVFCDFDGVIKDSVPAKAVGFEQLFLQYGTDVACRVRQHHEAHGGTSRYEKMPIYLGWVGEPATAERIQEFADRFSKLVYQAVIDSPWVPGVREYLLTHHLRQRFVLLTATPQDEIQAILHALGIAHCFDQVFGAPTRKATAMADTLQRMCCATKDAVMIGDSESDLEAAHANDVTFLLRCTTTNQLLQRRYTGLRFEDLVDE
jgi:phosphoglycolate phosphatase-like HAD superfamily hydrolase